MRPPSFPAEMWKKTERWDSAGKELFRVADRKKGTFALVQLTRKYLLILLRLQSAHTATFPFNVPDRGKV